jgi:cystathionine beta-lyase/cystathionine gamma-synthase
MAKKKQALRWADATRAIHAGEPRRGLNVPVTTPIVRTSNFNFAGTAELKRFAEGKSKAYLYTRYGNPTLAVAEAKIADLENGEAGLVTASGMAAISSALLAVLKSGDEVIATRQVYGGSYRLFRDTLPRLGIRTRFVDADLAGVDELVNEKTRALYVESPTNPILRLVDLNKAVGLARKHKLVSLIDSTFASPVLQKPLDLGFDLVLHSATKYLGGHSDIVAGAVAGGRGWVGKVRETMIHLGGCMDPDPAYLLIRGLKTLEVRVWRQCETAMAVARFLERHRKVRRVHYPGLASHPDHRLARRQMRGFGGMLAFDIQGGLAAARRFCDRTRIFLLAASLGGVESLIVLPMYTSHYRMGTAELSAAGVEPGTVRVSVGLEDPADLLEDLREALA